MRMVRTGVDTQVGHLLATKRATWKHALDSLHHDALRMVTIQNFVSCAFLDAAGMTGMPLVGLVVTLVAGQEDLLGIDNNDMVATINVWRIMW